MFGFAADDTPTQDIQNQYRLEVKMTYDDAANPKVSIGQLEPQKGRAPRVIIPDESTIDRNIIYQLDIVDANNSVLTQLRFILPIEVIDDSGFIDPSEQSNAQSRLKKVNFIQTLPLTSTARKLILKAADGQVIGAKDIVVDPSFFSKNTLEFVKPAHAQQTNVVHITFMSHKYNGDYNRFHNDVQKIIQTFKFIEPFKSRASQLQFNEINTSADLGCTIVEGKVKNCNGSLVKEVANNSGVPYDTLLVLINDQGGWGGVATPGLGYLFNNPPFDMVAIHEFGHAFGGLKDEYVLDTTGDGPIDNTTLVNCQKGPPPVGEWEAHGVAASEYAKGCTYPNWYRSSANSIMKNQETPEGSTFNKVSQVVLNRVLDKYVGSTSKACNPDPPTNLRPFSGHMPAGRAAILWDAPAFYDQYITGYALRIDDLSTPWNSSGDCSRPDGGDFCGNVSKIGDAYWDLQPGHTYHMWVHTTTSACGGRNSTETSESTIIAFSQEPSISTTVPLATVTGPEIAFTDQPNTFYAYAVGRNLTRLEVYRSPANQPNQWQLIGAQDCQYGSGSSCSGQFDWNAQGEAPGDYKVVVNAYDAQGYKCSGNALDLTTSSVAPGWYDLWGNELGGNWLECHNRQNADDITVRLEQSLPAPTNLTTVATDDYNYPFIRIKWTTTPDDRVDGYAIFRNGVVWTQVPSEYDSTGIFIEDLSEGQYVYQVKSYAFFNQKYYTSTPSNSVTHTVATPISAPANFSAIPSNSTDGTPIVKFTWNDEGRNLYYQMHRTSDYPNSNLTLITKKGASSATDRYALPNKTYTYFIEGNGYDNGRIVNTLPSSKVTVTTPSAIIPQLPTPTNLTATPISESVVQLKWQVPTSGLTPVSYSIYRDGQSVGSVTAPTTSYIDQVIPLGTHKYTVRAKGSGGTISPLSNEVSITLGQLPPPTNLTASVSGSSVVLRWTASVGVSGLQYQAFRGNYPLPAVTTTTVTDTAVPVGTHTYYVRAIDGVVGTGDSDSNRVVVTVGSPTSTPTRPAPTRTPTPIPTCKILTAAWKTTVTRVTAGAVVPLTITVTPQCAGKSIAFIIKESDGVLGSDLSQSTAPTSYLVPSGVTTVTTSWTTVYEQDGLAGIADPPEYYFQAYIVGAQSSTTVTSVSPLIQVDKNTTTPTTPTRTPTPRPPSPTPPPPKTWHFNTAGNDEGWCACSGFAYYAIQNGLYTGRFNSSGVINLVSSLININGNTYKKIVIRMKNSSSSTRGKIYFYNTPTQGWSELRSKTFTTIANDPNYTIYVIDMTGVSGWTGTIGKIRLDLLGATSNQSFSIDYIQVRGR